MEDLGKLGKVAVAWKERLKEGWGQPSLPAKVYQQHPAASLKHPFEKGLGFEKRVKVPPSSPPEPLPSPTPCPALWLRHMILKVWINFYQMRQEILFSPSIGRQVPGDLKE